jgi:hypothetical protein
MSARVRTAVRDVLVFAGSVAVLLFLAAYALADPGLKLAAVAGHVREHAGREVVVDGRVLESNGDALTNAVVEVRGPDRSRLARAGAQGFFRVDLLGPCAIYRIVLRGRSHGRLLVTRLEHRLCPGDELEVEGHVVSDEQFIWMPTR